MSRLYHVGSIPKDAVIVRPTSIIDIVSVEVARIGDLMGPEIPLIVGGTAQSSGGGEIVADGGTERFRRIKHNAQA